jgi:hypothetical protein
MTYILDEDVDIFLEHFGVKGMHWGVRKQSESGVSGRVDREASKDAREFARAQMFFGQGAGTRRKLIKNSVENKMKRDPNYRKAFEHHLSRQDMSQHVSKAKSERRRKDIVNTNKQRAGAIARRLTGEFGTQAAFVAIIMGGAAFLGTQKGRQLMQTSSQKIHNFVLNKRGKKLLNDALKMHS